MVFTKKHLLLVSLAFVALVGGGVKASEHQVRHNTFSPSDNVCPSHLFGATRVFPLAFRLFCHDVTLSYVCLRTFLATT